MIVPSSAERKENRHKTKKMQDMSHEALKSAGASMEIMTSSFPFSEDRVIMDASRVFDNERDVSMFEVKVMVVWVLILSISNSHTVSFAYAGIWQG